MALAISAPKVPGEIPFRFDLDAQARVLVALPMLIAFEPFVADRLSKAVVAFLRRGIIAPSDHFRFLRTLVRAERMRRHPVAVVPLLALAVVLIVYQPFGHRESAWGAWYGLISLSVFRFVLLRWYYWLLIWCVLLWRISRLTLRLNPFHSDGFAGIGFLAASVRAFAPVLVAQAVVVAGGLGHRIQLGASPQSFASEVLAVVLGLVALPVIPLAFFSPALNRARRKGQGEAGELAMRYVDAFRAKWIVEQAPAGERLLGSPDIQSLADLHSSYDVVASVRLLPVGVPTLLRTATAVLLPFVPLSLVSVPIDELATRVLKLLF